MADVAFTDDTCIIDGRVYESQPVLLKQDYSVDRASTAWLITLRARDGHSDDLVEKYAYTLSEFAMFLEWHDHMDWVDTSNRLLRQWGNSMLGRTKPGNVNTKINAVVNFLVWAQANGYFPRKVVGVNDLGTGAAFAVTVEAARYDKETGLVNSRTRVQSTELFPTNDGNNRRKMPSDKELSSFAVAISRHYESCGGVLSEALHERDQLMFELMLETAMRREEICGLLISMLPTRDEAKEKQQEGLVVRFEILGKGSGEGKRRLIEMKPRLLIDLYDHIDGWREEIKDVAQEAFGVFDVPEVFLSVRGKGLKPKSITDFYADRSREARVKVTPHLLRHIGATRRVMREIVLQRELNEGFFDEMTVVASTQELLGHSSIKTTLGYIHLARKELTRTDISAREFQESEALREEKAKSNRLQAQLELSKRRERLLLKRFAANKNGGRPVKKTKR